MPKIILDVDRQVHFDSKALSRHLHLIGTTGAGKTNALHVIFKSLLRPTRQMPCMFIIDPLGGLSRDLLTWMANPKSCPEYVRRRLIYIEPANTEQLIPFNPLSMSHPDELDFRVDRAMEVVLRAWGNQDIDLMPTLSRWLGVSMYALAQLNLPLGFAQYLLYPNCPEFNAIYKRQSPTIQNVLSELHDLSPNALANTLTSTRNRLQPFSQGILKSTFSTPNNYFDVRRFIDERRIVVINLASFNKLKSQVRKAFGAFVVNQVLATVRSMINPKKVSPCYLVLDEFQNFVTNDLVDALPELRQFGMSLILAHQSFSQLVQGDIDMTSLIWLAQNRIAFANSAMDADTIAHEFASLNYDPDALKHVMYSTKQLHDGYEDVLTRSRSQGGSESLTHSNSYSSSHQSSRNNAYSSGTSRPSHLSFMSEDNIRYQNNESSGYGCGDGHSDSSGQASSEQSSWSESETEGFRSRFRQFQEESSRTYLAFEEQRQMYAKSVRRLRTGEAYVKLLNDLKLYQCQVIENKIYDSPRIREKVAQLKEKNFQSDYFVSASTLETEFETLRQDLLVEKITMSSNGTAISNGNGSCFN